MTGGHVLQSPCSTTREATSVRSPCATAREKLPLDTAGEKLPLDIAGEKLPLATTRESPYSHEHSA